MSGIIVLILRSLLAFSLLFTTGYAIWFVWTDLKKESEEHLKE